MLWPSASPWQHWLSWSLLVPRCLYQGRPFCGPPFWHWCAFRGLLSVSQVEQYWNTLFWALSSPLSFFPFHESDLSLFYLWWVPCGKPNTIGASRYEVVQGCLPLCCTVTCLPSGEACFPLSSAFLLLLGIGGSKVSSGWEGGGIAALPIMKRTLDFDLHVVSGHYGSWIAPEQKKGNDYFLSPQSQQSVI